MTDEEVKELLVLWAKAKGGVFTDADLDALTAILEEHFPSPEVATLDQVKEVLGLKEN